MCECACVRVRACVCVSECVHVRVCTGVRGCVWVWVYPRACVYVGVCAWVYACRYVGVRARVCVCVRVRVRVCVCVSYLHSLLTLIRTPTQHRLAGSVLHFTPIVNKKYWEYVRFSVSVLLFGIEVYGSFDLVLDQTQIETLCDSLIF